MNKNILNKIILTGGIVDLDKFVERAELVVKDDTVLNVINLPRDIHLKIKIEKNKKLMLNIFDYAIDKVVNLDIELSDMAMLMLNDAFIAEKKYELNIDTKLYGDECDVSVNVRGINEENGTVAVIMNGSVAGETHNCKLNEYAKILNKSDSSNVLIPNMIVNTDDVEANHGVTIGKIDEEELFYLMSKGISSDNASRIIEDGFLLSIMDDNIKERVKNILVGR